MTLSGKFEKSGLNERVRVEGSRDVRETREGDEYEVHTGERQYACRQCSESKGFYERVVFER